MQTVDFNEIDKLMRRDVRTDHRAGRPSGQLVRKSENSYEPPKIRNQMSLTKMNSRHHEIVRLSILGYKDKQIADKLNITPLSVKNCLSSPIAKAMIGNINASRNVKTVELADQIQEILPDAIKLLEAVIDGGTLNDKDVRDRALQASTAKHLLGIGGLSPVKRVESRNQTTHLTADDIRQLVSEARDLGMCVGTEDVIEADYSEAEEE